ncbi:hypothetical protein [Antarctobacter sp.]|uniref:hypothetical protein n=1 Tax=Antarctobacter sp. TaxID=1872577 RepID=UPI003A930831
MYVTDDVRKPGNTCDCYDVPGIPRDHPGKGRAPRTDQPQANGFNAITDFGTQGLLQTRIAN